jgi:hypothetical protein
MSSELQTRVEDIYCSALEMESLDDRKSFLDSACKRNVELREKVEKMLACQLEVERFFRELDVVKCSLINEEFCFVSGKPQFPADKTSNRPNG